MSNKLKLFVRSTRFLTTLWYAVIFLLLEALLGMIIYFYLFNNSQKKLDSSLSAQAASIMRIVKTKHVDLDSFEPDSIYASEEDLIWDIIYDVVVFNERNTFIQISAGPKLLYKSANLGKINLDFAMTKKPEKEFSFFNEALSQNEIRAIQIVDDKYKVIVAYPQEHIYQTLNSLTDIYIVIAPIFFVISILGGALISQRSLSRIDRIIEKTEEITAQNLNDVIPGGEHSDEYGRLVRKMNEMISRIRTSVEYMNQFSISAAHELKTPLTILRGEIEVAIKSEKTPREYIEILRSNYEETLRLIKIVDNLFFISKSENSLIKLNPRQTEVREYFTSLLKNLSVLAAEKRIDIELKLENDFTTEFDNQLIKQAMINLVDNAVKYGTEKDPVIIEVKQANEKFWLLKVTNKVEELNSDKLEKIFDRFYRIESSRSRMNGGVGLGLAVVKSIALLHGGEINADKNNNELSIIMKLPL